jgi:hypothetical protein
MKLVNRKIRAGGGHTRRLVSRIRGPIVEAQIGIADSSADPREIGTLCT